MKNVCFGVKILTFNNPNKLKPMKEYVEEAIDCVRRQTYPHWKILLIGDHYEPHSEFVQLSRLAPKDKIVAVNLPRSPEREIHTGYNLWSCGGMTAFNFSLDLANELDLTHIANLDDDDIWFPRHLEFHADSYNTDPNVVMVLTHGHFKLPNNILPKHCDAPRPFFDQSPVWPEKMGSIAGNSCNCACSWDFKRVPLRIKNTVETTPWAKQAGDFWFWKEFETMAVKGGYRMVLRPEITVFQRHTHRES